MDGIPVTVTHILVKSPTIAVRDMNWLGDWKEFAKQMGFGDLGTCQPVSVSITDDPFKCVVMVILEA